MTYPVQDERTRPSVPNGTFDYDKGAPQSATPNGRSILVILGAIAVFVAMIVFFSSVNTDRTQTGSIQQVPIEQTQPAPVAPVEPATPAMPAQ